MDINVYFHQSDETKKLLQRILDISIDNNLKIKQMARKVDDMDALVNEINDSTNNIADDLATLAKQAEGGLTAEEATTFTSKLTDTAAKLKAIADLNPNATTNPGTGEPV